MTIVRLRQNDIQQKVIPTNFKTNTIHNSSPLSALSQIKSDTIHFSFKKNNLAPKLTEDEKNDLLSGITDEDQRNNLNKLIEKFNDRSGFEKELDYDFIMDCLNQQTYKSETSLTYSLALEKLAAKTILKMDPQMAANAIKDCLNDENFSKRGNKFKVFLVGAAYNIKGSDYRPNIWWDITHHNDREVRHAAKATEDVWGSVWKPCYFWW